MVVLGPNKGIGVGLVAQHQGDMYVGIIGKVPNDVLAIGSAARNKDGNVGHRVYICFIVYVG